MVHSRFCRRLCARLSLRFLARSLAVWIGRGRLVCGRNTAVGAGAALKVIGDRSGGGFATRVAILPASWARCFHR